MTPRHGLSLGLLLALVAVLALAAACGDDEPAFRLDRENVGLSEDLPDDWPDDFPIYPGAELEGSLTGRSGVEGVVATWLTPDGVQEVGDWYAGQLADGPWTATSDGDLPPDSRFFSATNDDGSLVAQINVSPDGSATAITVALGEDAVSGAGGRPGATAILTDATPGELPEAVDLAPDYPADLVPLPEDAHIVTASSPGGASQTFLVEFYSQQSQDDLRDYFRDELADRGWDETLDTRSGKETFLAFARGDDENESRDAVNVTIVDPPLPGYTSVVVAVTLFGE